VITLKAFILTIFLLLTSIVTTSAQNDKYYWIECQNFPYDFIVQTNDKIHIYYLDKRALGSQTLAQEHKIDARILLHMDQIKADFKLEDFPMYNFQNRSVQNYFHQMIEHLSPTSLLHLNDYVTHDFNWSQLQSWYQIIKNKPQVVYHTYPVLYFQDKRFLLGEHITY
jgi:hypothetical protein